MMAKLNDSPPRGLDAICAKLKDHQVPEGSSDGITDAPDAADGQLLSHLQVGQKCFSNHQSTTPSFELSEGNHWKSPARIPAVDYTTKKNMTDFENQTTPNHGSLDGNHRILMKTDTKRREYLSASHDGFNMSSIAHDSAYSASRSLNLMNSEATGLSGRKNRRKSTAPKNLCQLRDVNDTYIAQNVREDELLHYKQRSDGMASMIDSETEDENFLRQADLTKSKGNEQDLVDSGMGSSYDGVLDLSCSKLRHASARSEDYQMDDCGALDLSSGNAAVSVINKGTDSRTANTLSRSSTSSHREKQSVYFETNSNNVACTKPSTRDSHHQNFGGNSVNSDPDNNEADVMKDYAESTVNELLNMYGYGEDSPTFTGSVSLQNFATGRILNTCESVNHNGVVGDGRVPSEKRKPAEAENHETAGRFREMATTPSQEDTTESVGNQSEGSNEGNSTTGKIGALYSPLKNAALPDYGKYVRRYGSSEECGHQQCAELQYREHFHCVECTYKVFLKKEEMIRHFKWHRKRDESLQHGFLRYSPIDDCSEQFSGCVHNGRQTHYHCVQSGCSKVYISTSDVQMHSNYHRKDSAIIQLGFQRFRATEDCRVSGCPFYGQRTTHFHCRKPGCNFSFKNKADIEKHKTYHQKDEILTKDGFKKFMKYETCHYQGCRFSNLANHIHCIRPGCDYVLHSTSQLLSHKRKHERREIEFAYRRFKDTNTGQTAMLNPALANFSANGQTSASSTATHTKSDDDDQYEGLRSDSPTFQDDDMSDSNSLDAECFSKSTGTALSQFGSFDREASGPFSRSLPSQPVGLDFSDSKMEDDQIASYKSGNLGDSVNSVSTAGDSLVESEDLDGRSDSPQNTAAKVSPLINEKRERDETWKKYITRYTANDPCQSRCQLLYKDHYHCNNTSCGVLFKSKDGVREHARHHEQLDRITALSYMTYQADTSCVKGCQLTKQKHYHCLWTECQHIISDSEPVFQRLEHFHMHELSRTTGKRIAAVSVVKTNQDLKRRRGRPPKYPKIDIPVVPKIEMSEENIAAEIKIYGPNHPIAFGYKKFISGMPCPDDKCVYIMKEHYHCVRQRCHHSTDNKDVLNLHAKDFHSYITIHEGFEFFDRNINCRRPHCHNNKANRHFHCVRPKCDYSFVRYSTMTQHDKKHKMAEMGLTPHPTIGIPSSSIMNQMFTGSMASISSVSSALLMGPSGNPVMLQTSRSEPTKLAVGAVSGQRLIAPKPVLSVPQVIVGVSSPSTQNVAMNVSNNTIFTTSSTPSVNPIIIQPINTPVKPVSSLAPPSHVVIAPQVEMFPSESLPLAGLLQQRGATNNVAPQVNWETMLEKMHFDVDQSCNHPFCKLKKKDHYHCIDCNQAFSDTVRIRNHMAKHGLKLDSNNKILGWRYVPQIQNVGSSGGHADMMAKSVHDKTDVQSDADSDLNNNYEEDDEDDFDGSSSLNLNPMVFTDMLQRSQNKVLDDNDESSDLVMDLSESMNSDKSDHAHRRNQTAQDVSSWDKQNPLNDVADYKDMGAFHSVNKDKVNVSSTKSGEDGFQGVRRSARKRSATSMTKYDDFTDGHESIGDAKSSKVSPTCTTSGVNGKTNEQTQKHGQKWVSEGYQKFDSHLDCGVAFCSYKTNTLHFHCMKNGCQFGTHDVSLLDSHTEYHRNTELALGEDFTMFRVSQRCDSAMSCEYSGISTHYHCAKCPFVCTDLAKVTSHRKYHRKMEQIETQGFCKVAAKEDCATNGTCEFQGKQTHYHCLQGDCSYVATETQQMLVHNKKTHIAKV